MSNYLEGKEPDLETLRKIIRKATVENKIFPVLCGSALKNKGVQLVLDAVAYYLPSPLDIPPAKITVQKTGEAKTTEPDDNAPFAALAFKVAADPFVGKLIFFRVYSGSMKAGSYVLNTTNGKTERLSRIVRLHANTREDVD